MKSVITLIFILLSTLLYAQHRTEYEDGFIYAKCDTVNKTCTVTFYLRGKHYCSIKNGPYVIYKSPLYFGRPYRFSYTNPSTEIVIERRNRNKLTVIARYTLFEK